MLIGTIRDKKDKNNYYIELDEKSSKYQVICTNNSNTYLLNEIEVKTLINNIFNSELTYLYSKDNYEIYLDNSNNKRYLKEEKEDFQKFFENNGVSCIMTFNMSNFLNDLKQYILNNKRYIMQCNPKLLGIFSMSLAITTASIIRNDPYSFNNFLNFENYKQVDDIAGCISSSNGTYLTEEIKNSLICEDLFQDILQVKDDSRNYLLNQKLKDIDIEYFDESYEGNLKQGGYYTLKQPNILHIDEEYKKEEIYFRDILAHEFIHLLQDNNEYRYINETCAEILAYEYYQGIEYAYSDERKRVCTLMEIIDPKIVFECNFKGDTTSFEEEIGKYLNEEDTKELLDLFRSYEIDENTNKMIDKYLGKMYKNKYNKDIEDDPLISIIYQNQDTRFKRYYFNSHAKEYYDNFDIYETPINYDNIKNSNDTKYCIYERVEIPKSEYMSDYEAKYFKNDIEDKYYRLDTIYLSLEDYEKTSPGFYHLEYKGIEMTYDKVNQKCSVKEHYVVDSIPGKYSNLEIDQMLKQDDPIVEKLVSK